MYVNRRFLAQEQRRAKVFQKYPHRIAEPVPVAKIRTCEPSEVEEESASTKRHAIGVMGLIGELFVWKMITLTILCEHFMIRVLYVTPFKLSFPDQRFQSFTFWNARDDLSIIFNPHVYRCVAHALSKENLEYGITGATRITSSAGYRCYFNDGVAGGPPWLVSTIILLQPLILCSSFTVLATDPS
ncbi:hypothetical protein T07_3293 [Trichinella nelsoni]|uniref:Uncharacterized protein n=1 Tax=Trichinella nelsoni TaxID=6336 RepID=A0A0V0RD22_9BILA|nr:hypothetical protein T07_3293 [Trichinella nelsoni]